MVGKIIDSTLRLFNLGTIVIFCLLHIPVKDLVISGGYKEIKLWKCEKPNAQQVNSLQEYFLQNAATT